MRFLLILTIVACAQAQTRGRGARMTPRPVNLDPKAVEEGRQVYNRSCTACHGLMGTEGDRAPALAAQRRYLRARDQDMFDAIKNGIPGTLMPPMKLADGDNWKVVAYIRSLRATAADLPVKGDAAAGANIFWTKGECGSCHMIRGRGGLLGPDLSNIGAERSAAALRDALTQPRPHIPLGYQPASLVTREGTTLEGVIRNENNFSIQFIGRDGNLHLLERSELRKLDYASQSLMPTDYNRRLSAGEFENLLGFLSRQARDREER